jgi:hypothetical protein
MIGQDIKREARNATARYAEVVYDPFKVVRAHKANVQNLKTARKLGLEYSVTGEENMPYIPPGRVIFNNFA